MYDDSIEININTLDDVLEFDQLTQDIHEQAPEPVYAVISATPTPRLLRLMTDCGMDCTDEEESWKFGHTLWRQGFLHFLDMAVMEGMTPIAVLLQYQRQHPYALLCEAIPEQPVADGFWDAHDEPAALSG